LIFSVLETGILLDYIPARNKVIMKTTIQILAALLLVLNLTGQTVINVTQSVTINSLVSGNQISNTVINISDDATLSINQDVYLSNVTFNGGKISVSKKLTFWSTGSFNNVDVVFQGSSSLVTSGQLTIKNSEFVFNNVAQAIIYTSLELNNSRIKLLDNSHLEATSGHFNISNGGSVVVGDGSTSSKSYIKFNGATLNLHDNSFVTVANYNNYYFNWSNYYALAVNKSIQTTWNTLNCNLPGRNNCSAPNVYGPATLNFGGVSSYAMLPVKLTAFGVKAAGAVAEVAWTTAAELNANRFEVERSSDGQTWVVAATVKSTGTTSQESKYSYSDMLKVGGKYQYRLKMIDNDGSFEYSPVRTINAEGAGEMSIYPNPATSYIVINTKGGATDQLKIQFITISGQVIRQVNGNGNSVISVSDLTPGNYLVRVIKGSNEAQSFRLMVK